MGKAVVSQAAWAATDFSFMLSKIEKALLSLHLVQILVILVICLLGYGAYESSRADSAKLQGLIASQQQIIAQAQQQSVELSKQIEARDQAASTQIQALQKQVESLKTPSDLASYLQQSLNKQVPAPIIIQAPSSDPTKPVQVSVPQTDLTPLADLISKAQTNQVLLSACQQDSKDKDTQLAGAGQQLKALQTENTSLKKAAHPNLLKRIGRVAKYVGIGVGIGFVVGASHAL